MKVIKDYLNPKKTGDNLRWLRYILFGKGKTKTKMARLIGISLSYYINLERIPSKSISLLMGLRFAEATGIPVIEVLEELMLGAKLYEEDITDHIDFKAFGENLQKLRIEILGKKGSKRDMANKCSLSQLHYEKLESEMNRSVSLLALMKIAKGVEMGFGELADRLFAVEGGKGAKSDN